MAGRRRVRSSRGQRGLGHRGQKLRRLFHRTLVRGLEPSPGSQTRSGRALPLLHRRVDGSGRERSREQSTQGDLSRQVSCLLCLWNTRDDGLARPEPPGRVPGRGQGILPDPDRQEPAVHGGHARAQDRPVRSYRPSLRQGQRVCRAGRSGRLLPRGRAFLRGTNDLRPPEPQPEGGARISGSRWRNSRISSAWAPVRTWSSPNTAWPA